MFNIYNKFTRNDQRIQHGAPLVIGYTDDNSPVEIFVARIHPSNLAFKTFVDNAKKSNQRALDQADAETQAKIYEKITGDAVAACCIVGWSDNMCDAQGNLISFSSEAVARIRNDLPELFDTILEFGSTSSNYVGTFDEDATLKNSNAPLASS